MNIDAMVKWSIGIAKSIQHIIAVMTSSKAEANILRIELKLLRNKEVIIPQSALLIITLNTSGLNRI